VKIVDVDTPARGNGQPTGKGVVGFFRPSVRPAPSEQVPAPAVTQHQNPIPNEVLQRHRDEQQRKLESELSAERARLARDQQNELGGQSQGLGVDEIHRRHAAEQQAFEAHAARQRQVLAQRIQKQIVNRGTAKSTGRPGDQARDKGRDKGKGKGHVAGGE
jgi:hypothetical protein